MRELTKSEKKVLKIQVSNSTINATHKFTRELIYDSFRACVDDLLEDYGFSRIISGNKSIVGGKKYSISSDIQDFTLPSVSVILVISCLQEVRFGGNVWNIKRADFTWFPDNETQEDFINNLTQFLQTL